MMLASQKPLLLWASMMCATAQLSSGLLFAQEAGPASDLLSDPDIRPFVFEIPAPRGQILDYEGRSMARNRVARVAVVTGGDAESPEAYAAAVAEVCGRFDFLDAPTPEEIENHLKGRAPLPMIVSGELPDAKVAVLEGSGDERVSVRAIYLREYPAGAVGGHVAGFVSRTGPPADDPFREGEPLWPMVEGKSGLEKTFDEQLRGKNGLLSEMYSREGVRLQSKIIEPPVAGNDLVTTLHLPLQKLLEDELRKADRPGSGAIVDPVTGDILALASFPGYDPNAFVPSIAEADYQRLNEDEDKPLLNRAVAALYPPGSVFKPFVAVGMLDHGRITPSTVLESSESMEIDGRVFHNWTDKDNGPMRLEGALARSSNTWFYRAAIRTGGRPILHAVAQFGFGTAPGVPLPGVAAGSLPEKVITSQGAANLSIGQGDVLASPLHVALAMGGLANGNIVPRPRLVTRVQGRDGTVLESTERGASSLLNFYHRSVKAVHAAMSTVVNHENGTGRVVRHPEVEIYGKTGTAQWSKGGAFRPAVWFAGFVKETDPPLAFAVVLEGQPDEEIFGGTTAGPVVRNVLHTAFADPEEFGIHLRTRTGVPLANNQPAGGEEILADADTDAPIPKAVPVNPETSRVAHPQNAADAAGSARAGIAEAGPTADAGALAERTAELNRAADAAQNERAEAVQAALAQKQRAEAVQAALAQNQSAARAEAARAEAAQAEAARAEVARAEVARAEVAQNERAAELARAESARAAAAAPARPAPPASSTGAAQAARSEGEAAASPRAIPRALPVARAREPEPASAPAANIPRAVPLAPTRQPAGRATPGNSQENIRQRYWEHRGRR